MKLTMAKRAKMPKKDFAGGGPKGAKGFPMPDKEHARLAISGATRSEHAGNISASKAASIKARAHKMLGETMQDKSRHALGKVRGVDHAKMHGADQPLPYTKH